MPFPTVPHVLRVCALFHFKGLGHALSWLDGNAWEVGGGGVQHGGEFRGELVLLQNGAGGLGAVRVRPV